MYLDSEERKRFNDTNNSNNNYNEILDATIECDYVYLDADERERFHADTSVYNYSFSMYPENDKPSGSANFSRVDTKIIEHTFEGSVNFGNHTTTTISRNGDLVNNMYLTVNLPPLEPEPQTYVPLPFWFNSTPGSALPLVSLPPHPVTNHLTREPDNYFVEYVNVIEKADASGLESYIKNKLYNMIINLF